MWIAGLLGLCAHAHAGCAFERLDQGCRSVAMGGASTAFAGDPWCIFSNPAGLATVQGPVLSVFHVPDIFGIPGLARSSFTLAVPALPGVLGVGGIRFGFAEYREVMLALGCGALCADRFGAGVGVEYCRLSAGGYGAAGAVVLNAGILVRVSDGVWWGCSAANLAGAAIGASRENLPRVFSSGLLFCPGPGLQAAVALTKDIMYPGQVHAGAEYILAGCLALRCGTSSDPSTLCAGLGIRLPVVEAEYACSSHVSLGITHHLSLTLHFGD